MKARDRFGRVPRGRRAGVPSSGTARPAAPRTRDKIQPGAGIWGQRGRFRMEFRPRSGVRGAFQAGGAEAGLTWSLSPRRLPPAGGRAPRLALMGPSLPPASRGRDCQRQGFGLPHRGGAWPEVPGPGEGRLQPGAFAAGPLEPPPSGPAAGAGQWVPAGGSDAGC